MHFMKHNARLSLWHSFAIPRFILRTTTYFSLPYLDILDTKLVGQEFCVLLNVSLESGLNAWILEHQCRCPLVMQYISYDENMCTHVYYYFRKHPSRSVNLTSLHRVWRKFFAFRESPIHYIPIEI